jgi:hypothetical protein
MPVKTLKPPTKPRVEAKAATGNIISELSNSQAYNLVCSLELPQNGHIELVYITGDGYFFSQGTDLYELIDLDPSIPAEALLLKQGRKQKRILLPGKYIARKRVVKEYTRNEIIECRNEIIAAHSAEQKILKAKQKAAAGEEDGSAVKAITEALQKLTETKKG